jgi:hypothetical protein
VICAGSDGPGACPEPVDGGLHMISRRLLLVGVVTLERMRAALTVVVKNLGAGNTRRNRGRHSRRGRVKSRANKGFSRQ